MIFIPGNVPSLKNRQVKTARGIFHAKPVKKYLQSLGIQNYWPSKKVVKGYVRRPNIFHQVIGNYFNDVVYPFELGFHFVRGSRHKFDFNNANQIICDLLVAHDFIIDDNMNFLIPYCLKINKRYYSYDKDKPGVWLKK